MSAGSGRHAGFTLVEVLLAMTLMLIVTGATLSVFAVMERGARDNERLDESQMEARVATDALAKRLRNLASPTSAAVLPQPLEKAEANEVIFRTVSSEGPAPAGNPENLERYRYCLSSDGKLYVERQSWTGATPALPTTTGCGVGDGWPGTRSVAAQDVVNAGRPLFRYQVSPTPGTYSEQSSVSQAAFPTDIAIRVELFVDPDPNHAPGEATLTTRVFLRNQNRPPTATISSSSSGGPTVVLNGSDSSDPENNPLYFQWSDNGVVKQDFSQQATYTLTASGAGTHVISLVVRDIGGLQATAAPLTITCTANPLTCS